MEILTNNILIMPNNTLKSNDTLKSNAAAVIIAKPTNNKKQNKIKDPSVFNFSASIGPFQYENYGDHQTLGVNVISLLNIDLAPAEKETVNTRFPQDLIDKANIALPGYTDMSTNHIQAPIDIYRDFNYKNDNSYLIKVLSLLGTIASVFSTSKWMTSEDEKTENRTYTYNHGIGGTAGYVYKFSQEITFDDNSTYFKVPVANIKLGLVDFHNRYGHLSAFGDLSYERFNFNNTYTIDASEKITYNGSEPTVNNHFSGSYTAKYISESLIYRAGLVLTTKLFPNDRYDFNIAKLMLGVQYKDKDISGVQNCTVKYDKYPFTIFLGFTLAELNFNFITKDK